MAGYDLGGIPSAASLNNQVTGPNEGIVGSPNTQQLS